MSTLLASLLPALKPFVKQVFDQTVAPKLNALVAQIPNADAEALVAKFAADVEAEVDKLLS